MNQFFETATIKGIAKHLEQEDAVELEALPSVVENIEQRYLPFLLTDVQQAYLLGRSDAFELGNISTHVYIEANLLNLNVERFTQAWNLLLQRHEMLRAVFSLEGSQRILETVPFYDILFNDVSESVDIDRDTYLDRCS